MLTLTPINLKTANAFVQQYHRHHKPTRGHKFSIEDCLPNMNDGKGTSLIIVKTKKGNILLEQIKGLCNLEKCDYYKAIRKNSAEVHSVPKPQCRDEFFADMN